MNTKTRHPQLGELSAKRAHRERDKDPIRAPSQWDRDRIIHSTAFRRLEYKTQVFINYEGDHYRTRLTHSLEVAQIARSLVFPFIENGGDEPLAEALALAHDLGHPPFGHEGETTLSNLHKPFNHNRQTMRVVTLLENRHPEYRGLNLSHNCLDGLLKHNYPGGELRRLDGMEFDPKAPPSLEAEMATLADDIAYNCHDLDDGLRGEKGNRFFELEEVAAEVPMVREELRYIKTLYRFGGEDGRKQLIRLLISRLVSRMIQDIRSRTTRRIADGNRLNFLRSLRSEKNAHMAAFSIELRQQLLILREFLTAKMYKSPKLQKIGELSRELLSDLFRHYRKTADSATACDYIAGMTDRFAVLTHQKYFPTKNALRLGLEKGPETKT